MSNLISFLSLNVIPKLVGDFTNLKELKGGMSSNKCFYLKSNSIEHTLIVFRDIKKTDEEIYRWQNVTLGLKEFKPIVRIPQTSSLIHFKYEGQELKASLYNYIDGNTIKWSGYNSLQIKELAVVMKRLHDQLLSFNGKLPLWKDLMTQEMENFLSYMNYINPYFESKLHFQINQAKLSQNFSRILNYIDKDYEQTVLHYDLQRANLIFKEGKLCGIIDFEKACRGPRIADISKSCAYLLHDKKWHSTKYIKHYFFEGYGNVTDFEMFESLIVHHFLMEMKNWLFNTPFESLVNNLVFMKIIHFLIKEKYVQQI